MTGRSTPDSSLYIRRARKEDARALSRICLLTADAGTSAENIHSYGEFPGLVYALPFVHVPHTAGFVLARKVEEEGKEGDADPVVGYILFALDTRAFEAAAEREWYPPLRVRYPKITEDAVPVCDPPLMDADKRFISLLHAPQPASEACVKFSPAHLGWGRRLIAAAIEYLRDEGGLQSVWLGTDPRNADAGSFYARLGFKPIDGAPMSCVGLKFDDWTAQKET
ncbi:hypothetical protein EW145_g1583 [Phellinidium pouzarii]|uniref:N-acetyltransferase domain-containing protein n=1 Tax=Phellinidium pouzarii TaxID=167371 RepID=A0A4S4LEJ5_9AGAM|nr:hypothetical protein EW145_g1583 [Phellinidium pouzarii]